VVVKFRPSVLEAAIEYRLNAQAQLQAPDTGLHCREKIVSRTRLRSLATARDFRGQYPRWFDPRIRTRTPGRRLRARALTGSFANCVIRRRVGRAFPRGPRVDASGYRVRHDEVDKAGGGHPRYKGRLRHVGVGRAYSGWRVVLLVAGREVRIIGLDGAPLRHLYLDPAKDSPGLP
jgi:hypothetical protein